MEKDEGDSSMPIDPKSVWKMAKEYTAAWNSKSAEAVASFYAEDGQIIINRGEPWKGRSGIWRPARTSPAAQRNLKSPHRPQSEQPVELSRL